MLSQTTRDGLKTTVLVLADPDSQLGGLGLTGYGTARCRPDDLYVEATGELIALGRAIQDFGQRVEAMGCAESVSYADVERVLKALALGAADEEPEPVPQVEVLGFILVP